MYIVHLCTEVAPIAKVGGLADVIYGLSRETAKHGHQVDIILPKYDCLDYNNLIELKVDYRELWSFEGSASFNNTIWSAKVGNLTVFFIEPHHPSYYFSRGCIYGCPDDIDRFTYFSRAALEYLYKANKRPDILHLHDWPVSLAAPLYKDMYIPLGMKIGGVVLTIHNLEHQGKCASWHLSQVGLDISRYLSPESLQDPVIPELINLLKGGIEYADAVTTVSPTYEKEIKTPEGGHGLHDVLKKNEKKLKGILNGIDEAYWKPETDPHLIAHYSTHPPFNAEKLEKVLKAKEENRSHLRIHLGLKKGPFPLVGLVTRLVPQKGPALIKHALLRTLERGGQFVLLGAAASLEIEQSFLELKHELSENPHVSISLDTDESLAHLIFAAADMFVIPSIFEPCGLTQMIALRYGTVPIVRATGGLADTVKDINSQVPENEKNGFVFEHPNFKEVRKAIDRALDYWSQDQKKWQQLMLQGMSMDFSWKHATPEYLDVYRKLISL